MTVFSVARVAWLYSGLASPGPAVALATGVALELALFPTYGASGAAVAASAALLARGIGTAFAYRSRAGFAWRDLIPRLAEVRTLSGLIVRLCRSLAAPVT
jgi:hypothetical protein